MSTMTMSPPVAQTLASHGMTGWATRRTHPGSAPPQQSQGDSEDHDALAEARDEVTTGNEAVSEELPDSASRESPAPDGQAADAPGNPAPGRTGNSVREGPGSGTPRPGGPAPGGPGPGGPGPGGPAPGGPGPGGPAPGGPVFGSKPPEEVTHSSPTTPAPSPEAVRDEAESKQEAVRSGDANAAAASAANARAGEAPYQDQLRVLQQARVERAAAHAARLETEVAELTVTVGKLSDRYSELEWVEKKGEATGVWSADREASHSEMLRVWAEFEENRSLLSRKRSELDDARREVRLAGGNDNVGSNWGALISGSQLKKLQLQQDMEHERHRLETNLNYLTRAASTDGPVDVGVDLCDSQTTDSALSEDVHRMQKLIRHNVVRVATRG